MWHTPDGDRALTTGQWALVGAGLLGVWDAVEAGGATGVKVFDALQTGQRVALLAQIARALTDAEIPAPPLTAAAEGALATAFVFTRAILFLELDGPGNLVGSPTQWRRLVLGAIGDAADRDGPLSDLTDPDAGVWEALVQEIEGRLFWDQDYEMADDFLDLPPEAVEAQLDYYGIDRDYFTAVPDDPDDQEVEAARRLLADLTGRGRPARPGG